MSEQAEPQFVPPWEQTKLWPEISGNTINGRGESDSRRPTPIMWHDASIIAHGPVQDYVWAQGARHPGLLQKRAERQKLIEGFEPAPVAASQSTGSPQQNHLDIKQIADESGADIIGCVRLDPEWIFEGYECDYKWIIVLGLAMDHEQLSTAPAITAALEVVDKYTKGWVIARPVADWIRQRGWRAQAHGGPMAGPVNMIPAALACGFGELGKHGSLINREYGSSFRLSAVFTDFPLVADEPDEFAADDFCSGCQVCVKACPVDAISNLRQLVRGAEKWYVDFDKCFTFFAETAGCAICIAVCPWSFPGRAPRLADKWTRRRERKRLEL